MPLGLRWLGVFLFTFRSVYVVWGWQCDCYVFPLDCSMSLSLPPGSKEPPSSLSVIGQRRGVLDTAWCWLLRDVFQQMVEVRECHHIGGRIRGERLSSRSCVVPPLLFKLKSQRQDTIPLYEWREIRGRTRGYKLREEFWACLSLSLHSAPLLFRYYTISSFFFFFFKLLSPRFAHPGQNECLRRDL